MEDFLQQFGFVASVVGGLLQGEIVYLTAMLTVSMGYLNPYSVALAFFLGSLARDWATFWFARKKGEKWVNKKPKLQARAVKVSQQLEQSPIWVLVTYRFIYGFKIVILLVAGISKIPWPTVAFWTSVSTALWIGVFGALGYYCGNEVIEGFGTLKDYTWQILVGVLVCVLAYWYFFRWRRVRKACEEVGIEI